MKQVMPQNRAKTTQRAPKWSPKCRTVFVKMQPMRQNWTQIQCIVHQNGTKKRPTTTMSCARNPQTKPSKFLVFSCPRYQKPEAATIFDTIFATWFVCTTGQRLCEGMKNFVNKKGESQFWMFVWWFHSWQSQIGLILHWINFSCRRSRQRRQNRKLEMLLRPSWSTKPPSWFYQFFIQVFHSEQSQ